MKVGLKITIIEKDVKPYEYEYLWANIFSKDASWRDLQNRVNFTEGVIEGTYSYIEEDDVYFTKVRTKFGTALVLLKSNEVIVHEPYKGLKDWLEN